MTAHKHVVLDEKLWTFALGLQIASSLQIKSTTGAYIHSGRLYSTVRCRVIVESWLTGAISFGCNDPF